jgi:uncharacterized protein YkwD
MHYLRVAKAQSGLITLLLVFIFIFLLSACQPDAAATPQIAPNTADPLLASSTPAPPSAAQSETGAAQPGPTQASLGQASPTAQPLAETPTEVSSSGSSSTSPGGVSPTPTAEQPTQPAPTQTSPTATAASTGSGSTASSTAACTDKAAFYGDVTIPDDTGFEQGVGFTKTWRFRNEGDCTWDETYAMVFAGGEILNGPLSAPLSMRVAPGEIANLSIDLRTPDRGGVFRSYWEFQNPQGARFGTGAGGHEPFWAQVIVSWMPPGGGNSGGSGGSAGGSSPTTPPATPASGGGSPTATPEAGSGGGSGSGASPTPSPTPDPNAGNSTVPGAPANCQAKANPGFLQVLLGLINQARADNVLDPVSPSAPLYAAAAVHSADMACNNFINHIGSDGSSWYTRIAAQGYSYSTALENIVVGNPDFGGNAQYAYNWWMNSQVHRDNILNPKVTELGLGYVYNPASEYGGYFTLVLARP